MCTAPAIAQDAPSVTLKLSAVEVSEIERLINLQPILQSTPPAYWDLQINTNRALEATPEAMRALLSAGSAVR
jgi:hypothetical protein